MYLGQIIEKNVSVDLSMESSRWTISFDIVIDMFTLKSNHKHYTPSTWIPNKFVVVFKSVLYDKRWSLAGGVLSQASDRNMAICVYDDFIIRS